ncbi:hypothetical protein MFUR16E_03110 [Methylobacterium fujisawaense]
MDDGSDLILEAVDALRGAGVAVAPIGDELESWQIGDFVYSDADLWRLAASRRRSRMATRGSPAPCRRPHRLEAPGRARTSGRACWRR